MPVERGEVAAMIAASTQQIASAVRQLQGRVRFGDVNPEGVIAAPPGTIWCDDVAGEVYRKASGAGPTGWKLMRDA
jgi:hypothetical protein